MKKQYKYRTKYIDIPFGEKATEETVKNMFSLAHNGSQTWEIIQQARDIVRDVPSKDKLGEIKAIYDYLGTKKFRHDPHFTELLQDPRITLGLTGDRGTGVGDCDDRSIAVLSLARSVGIPGRIITLAGDSQRPDDFSHVYVELYDQNSNRWIPCDVTPQAFTGMKDFGWSPEHYFKKRERPGVAGWCLFIWAFRFWRYVLYCCGSVSFICFRCCF